MDISGVVTYELMGSFTQFFNQGIGFKHISLGMQLEFLKFYQNELLQKGCIYNRRNIQDKYIKIKES